LRGLGEGRSQPDLDLLRLLQRRLLESLGYYFDASPVPDPTEDDVLAFYLESFPEPSA
jgi:hypothetical protein